MIYHQLILFKSLCCPLVFEHSKRHLPFIYMFNFVYQNNTNPYAWFFCLYESQNIIKLFFLIPNIKYLKHRNNTYQVYAPSPGAPAVVGQWGQTPGCRLVSHHLWRSGGQGSRSPLLPPHTPVPGEIWFLEQTGHLESEKQNINIHGNIWQCFARRIII